MDWVEDAAVFFMPGDPGVSTATILGASVLGALDKDYQEPLDDSMRRWGPMFTCVRASLPLGVTVGTPVTVGGISYSVRSIDDDDPEPFAVLHLNK